MIMTLADLQPGQSAKVVGLKDRSLQNQKVRKYLAMGLVPGVEITLVQRFPAYVFEMGYSQFAIDRELASEVLVRVEGSNHDGA
jgi:Fe2+ transport system protein FeoA